ncbi:hypothetical protein Ddc_06746 [Ditylenchus destructor]|nr:hypothetical protein Ddc_06746 [Ditylenchus destructor]
MENDYDDEPDKIWAGQRLARQRRAVPYSSHISKRTLQHRLVATGHPETTLHLKSTYRIEGHGNLFTTDKLCNKTKGKMGGARDSATAFCFYILGRRSRRHQVAPPATERLTGTRRRAVGLFFSVKANFGLWAVAAASMTQSRLIAEVCLQPTDRTIA